MGRLWALWMLVNVEKFGGEGEDEDADDDFAGTVSGEILKIQNF